jgi:GcrA cell cycle regulator
MHSNYPWPEEKIEQLRKLASQDLTASEIASSLGGTTRNAIIGQCKRRGIKLSGTKEVRRPKKPPEKSETDPRIVISKPLPDPTLNDNRFKAIAGKPISLADARDCHCRWVIGECHHMMICGANVSRGGPYCEDHARMAFQGRV